MNAHWKSDLASLVVRVSLAIIFISHGYLKLYVHGGGDWAPKLDPLLAQVVAWGELLGGAALLLGLLSRLAALVVAVIQLGAIAMIRREFIPDLISPGSQTGFTFSGGGYEYNFALVAMCIAVMLLGSGVCSLDHLIRSRLQSPAPGTAASPPVAAGQTAEPAMRG